MHNKKIEDITQLLCKKQNFSPSEIEDLINTEDNLFFDLVAYREVLMRNKKIHSFNKFEEYTRLHKMIHTDTRSIIYRSLSIAASIIFLLISSFYIFNYKEEVKEPLIVKVENQEKVFRQINSKAVLTLGDGTVVKIENSKQDISDKNVQGIINDTINGLQYNKTKVKVNQTVFNTLKVPKGGEYALTLADGTRVFLNSNSELRFPIAFNDNERRVFLKGEAYFDVSHNKSKPFIVSVNKAEIEVLGTEFNINAYDDEDEMYTTLVKGSVKFTSSGSKNSNILKPNQQIEFNRETKQSVLKEVDVREFTSWVDGEFYFKSLSLDKLFKQLNRWYDVDVEFVDEEMKYYKFRGVIKRDMDLDQVLKMIKETSKVKIETKKGKVLISK